MHHPMRMHHTVATEAKLEVLDDAADQAITVRLGPANLPAHSDHMTVAQPPDFFLKIPVDGWLIAFHPRLVDAAGNSEPNKLLHHVALWNTVRPDFLCPNKEEHVFGAGGEMNDWPAVPGFGYRVHPGDRIRIETMYGNPTGTDYPSTYLEVRIEYRKAGPGGESLKSVYPAWFDVMGCRNSGYDLAPGKSAADHQFTLGYSGVLLGVGGHLHDYGRRLTLGNITRKEDIATLDAKLDPDGHLLGMPIEVFSARGGDRLEKGEVLEVKATYDNPTGRNLTKGAMGIVVGYFLPDQDAELAALVHHSSSSHRPLGDN